MKETLKEIAFFVAMAMISVCSIFLRCIAFVYDKIIYEWIGKEG